MFDVHVCVVTWCRPRLPAIWLWLVDTDADTGLDVHVGADRVIDGDARVGACLIWAAVWPPKCCAFALCSSISCRSCFEKLSCFEIPHIGVDVTEDHEYDGTVSVMRPPFLFMIRNFVEQLFNEKLEAKIVNGRQVCSPRIHQLSSL